MQRSIFFSFACIDLKFCKQPPDHCRIYRHETSYTASFLFGPQFRRLGYAASALNYVETSRLLYYYHQACEAGEGIIGHRGIQFFSVCLSVCHQTPPSLWDRSLPKCIHRFFRPLWGSVKIWYWPQSNPPAPMPPPPKWPPKMKIFIFWRIDLRFCT